jgi:hypothetical protein
MSIEVKTINEIGKDLTIPATLAVMAIIASVWNAKIAMTMVANQTMTPVTSAAFRKNTKSTNAKIIGKIIRTNPIIGSTIYDLFLR